jgi:hypothetical protein
MTDTDYAITVRLQRAARLSNLLRRIVSRYVKSDAIEVVNDFASAPGFLIVRVASYQGPPEICSVLAGEVLYHYRAALNYIACELTRYNGRSVSRSVEYPICLRPEDYRDPATGRLTKSVKDRIGRMRPSDQVAIEREQPFNRYQPPEGDPLAILQNLSNYDRHQFIHLTAVSTNMSSNVFTPAHASSRFEQVSVNHGFVGDMREVARYQITPGPELDVHVQSDVRCDVAFSLDAPGGGRQVVKTLGAIGVRLGELITCFEPWKGVLWDAHQPEPEENAFKS